MNNERNEVELRQDAQQDKRDHKIHSTGHAVPARGNSLRDPRDGQDNGTNRAVREEPDPPAVPPTGGNPVPRDARHYSSHATMVIFIMD